MGVVVDVTARTVLLMYIVYVRLEQYESVSQIRYFDTVTEARAYIRSLAYGYWVLVGQDGSVMDEGPCQPN